MADVKLKQVRAELREMNDADLHKEIAAQKASLFELRRRHAMRQLDNTVAIRKARKQIARVLTLLREREIAAQGETKTT